MAYDENLAERIRALLAGHDGVTGVCRRCGIASRNTWDDAGARVGLRNAGDVATARNDGTVRPPSAVMVWPCCPTA